MAVGYRSSSASGSSDAQVTTVNVPVPTGAAAGDIALLCIESWLDTSTDPVFTWPTGFTQTVYYESTTDGFERIAVAWKRLTAADTGNYTITVSQAAGISYWSMAHCILITGAASTGDPIEATNTAQNSGTSLPSTSVTTVTQPFLAHFIANENNATKTPPTNFTEVQDGNYLETAYRIPGTTGTHTTSGGSTSASTLKLAVLVAVKADGAPTAGGLAAQRSTTASTGVKGARNSAATAQRPTTQDAGRKSTTGAARTQQRSVLTSAGRKGAVAQATDPQRSATSSAASKAATGTAQDQQRSATASTGSGTTGITGSGTVRQRSSTTSAGRKDTASAGGVTCRTSSSAVGTHRGSGPGAVQCRSTSAGSGRRHALGAGRSSARSAVTASGTRAATGAARVQQRVATGSAEGIPFTPASDPQGQTRRLDGTAATRHLDGTAVTREGPMKTGDLEPPWIVDISDAKASGDLNGVASWRFVAKLNDTIVFTDTDPTVTVDPTNTYLAAAKHSWVGGQTDNPGTYRAEVVAVWPGGREQTFPGKGQATITIERGLD